MSAANRRRLSLCASHLDDVELDTAIKAVCRGDFETFEVRMDRGLSRMAKGLALNGNGNGHSRSWRNTDLLFRVPKTSTGRR